jgi:aromatic ring-opening dioxygenase LigB subunit
MTLERLYVLPHGDEILDKPNKESAELYEKMKEITAGDNSDTILVLTPHGASLSRGIAIINTENLHGEYQIKTGLLKSSHKTNKQLVRNIVSEFGKDLVEINFATSSGPLSVFPEDFGTIIPLTFFRQTKAVIIGQPRMTDRTKLMQLGEAIWYAIDNMDEKISVIFSADQAHTHNASGPYGFSDYARTYEDRIVRFFKSGSLEGIEDLQDDMISEAKPDSYWNMVILNGFLKNSGMKMVLDYHYVENYFGMLLAHGTK